jgi:tetratricopeptide (TPR) repeat protein
MERTSKHLILIFTVIFLLISRTSIAIEIDVKTELSEPIEPAEAGPTSSTPQNIQPEPTEQPIASGQITTQKTTTKNPDPKAEDIKTEKETVHIPTAIAKESKSKPKSIEKAAVKKVIDKPSTLIDVLELEDHANNKRYQKGYALAQKILPHWEGDSTFDFLYGVHAIETGHYDEATFAFERLTLLNPKTLRYRLELARALYFNNNLDTAQTEFEIALAANPPENVKTNIKGFLNRIQKSKETFTHNWAVSAGINLGFDSNINSGTEEDSVEIPNIGFVSLQKEAQSQSSAFNQFNTQGIYSFSHKKHHSLDASFNTTHKRNSEVSTYDLDVINLSASYSWQPIRNIRLQGGLTNTDVKLDGQAYQNQSAVNAMALYTRKNGFSFGVNLNMGNRSAETNTAPNADISLYSLSMIWPSSNVKSTNLSVYTGNDDVNNVDLAHFGKQATGVNFGTKVLITQSIVRSMMISVNSTEYQAADPNFQKIRKDTAVMGTWGYAWNLSKYISVSSNIVVSHNASNLDLFTSYRAIINTGLSVNF